jgi:hypothetical protein
MTPEEVKKTQETIEKLRRLAAPNSGATEHERTAAKTKAETLEAKIKPFITSGTQHREWTGRVKTQSTTGTGSYSGKSKADFKEEFKKKVNEGFNERFMEELIEEMRKARNDPNFFGFFDNAYKYATDPAPDSPPSASSKGYRKRTTKEEFDAYQKAKRENFKDSVRTPEEDSRAFLSAMEMNKIYFYQCETGIYVIEQMTVEFLNEQIASIARKIRELEMEAFPELNHYAINSHKVMKDRLKMVRDRKVAKDVGDRRWRM